MSSFLDQSGARQQLPIDVTIYAQAGEAGMSVQDFLNAQYRTDTERYGTIWEQVCASEQIFLRDDRRNGIRATAMKQILDPAPSAAITTKDGVPTSRILFPAVILQAVEDKLVPDMSMAPAAFESMIAVNDSISGERYEHPVINYTNPEQARSLGISQLATPTAMMLITVSDKQYTIPTFSLGLEISDQALRSQSIDMVTLSIARQIMVERNERANGYILSLLNGDVDVSEQSLASLGRVRTSVSFDAASTGGVLTQKAWVKYLANNSARRTITHVVTDIDGALAVENRANKPTVNTDDNKSRRITTEMDVVNPLWPDRVKFFITTDPAWPAGTLMGLDSRYGVRRVRNLLADYTAVEAYVMRRATAMRFDHGEHVNRLFPEAFDTLTLS